MKKLNYLGIGPKIGGVTIPILAITIFISLRYKQLFSIYSGESCFMMYLGILLVISGLILYFSTLPLLLKGLKETKLITTGAYSLCRNPLYAAFIIFLLPGIGLIMNSWIVILTCLIAYILFKINIRSEYLEMENCFGDEYKKYSAVTSELFPFTLKKTIYEKQKPRD